MLTFQNGGTEVEGSGVREDAVFAVSHEIFQCSYNDRNNPSDSRSKSESGKSGVCYDSKSERRNDDDKKKEEMKINANDGHKDKEAVHSTATAECTTSDGTYIDLQCMYVCLYACIYVCMYVCMNVCMYVHTYA